MKNLPIALSLLLLFSCEKNEIKQNNNNNSTQTKTSKIIRFKNMSTMSGNTFKSKPYSSQYSFWSSTQVNCNIDVFQSGIIYILKNNNDTICSFKISNDNVISWKNFPPHYVGLGGCTTNNSLTIYE